MKVKVSEATNIQLDWMVCHAEGIRYVGNYAKSWRHCGPIIEREKIGIDCTKHGWIANADAPTNANGLGPTPLIAAMRCYVVSKLGDEVEVPNELNSN